MAITFVSNKHNRIEINKPATKAPVNELLHLFPERRVFVGNCIPFLNRREVIALDQVCKATRLTSYEKATWIKEQALSSKKINLSQFMEYLWLMGRSVDEIAENEHSFTREILNLDIRYFKIEKYHSEVQKRLKALQRPFTYEFLSKIARCFPECNFVLLRNTPLREDALRMLPELEHLKTLEIDGCAISIRGAHLISSLSLEKLSLDTTIEVADVILQRCPLLHTLSLACSFQDDHREALIKLAPRLANMLHLTIEFANVDDSVLIAFAKNMTKLKTLLINHTVIGEETILTAAGVEAIAKRNPNLEEFFFPGDILDDDLLLILFKYCPRIVPDLCGARITLAGFDVFLKQAQKFPDRFKVVDVCGTEITKDALLPVPKMMPWLTAFHCDSDLLDDALLHELLTHCLNLNFVTLHHSSVTRIGVMELVERAKQSPTILGTSPRLHISGVSDLSCEDIREIVKAIPSLCSLDLPSGLLDDDLLLFLFTHGKMLENIQIAESQLSKMGIWCFVEHAKTNPKCLGWGPSLNLTETAVTKEHLLAIPKELPQLRTFVFDHALLDDDVLIAMLTHFLDLRGIDFFSFSNISDKSISPIIEYSRNHPSFLANCDLDFVGTDLSIDGIRELMEHYPNGNYRISGPDILYSEFLALEIAFPNAEIHYVSDPASSLSPAESSDEDEE